MILKKQMWEDPDHPTKLKTVPANEKKPDYYARKMCNYFITVTEVTKNLSSVRFFLSLIQECYLCFVGQTENLREIKDSAIEDFLESTKLIPKFDAQKCPVVKY